MRPHRTGSYPLHRLPLLHDFHHEAQPLNDAQTRTPRWPRAMRRCANSDTRGCRLLLSLSTALLLLSACPLARTAPSIVAAALPDAPQPNSARPAPVGPCQVRNAAAATVSAGATSALKSAGLTPPHPVAAAPCPIYVPIINWYSRFLDGPKVKPLTPKEKAWLAIRNVSDPFNALTILGQSAIAVGADSHSPYGPGMPGFARNVGVSYAQDMTGEFFGTFLIPSIVHQDPHYHRMPSASVPRRILHCISQVAWTQGDNGRGMLNYSDLLGFAIDAEISNLYVPGEATNAPSTAARYSIGLALAPTDNFITEFLPDIARRIHVRVVLVQRIINQVAKTESPSTQ